jgi:hypothetical protein
MALPALYPDVIKAGRYLAICYLKRVEVLKMPGESEKK